MDETDARQDRKSWSARSIGSRWQHRFFYALIRLAGRRAAYVMVVFVAIYYVLFRPSVRNRSRPYLSRRFPGRNALLRLWDSYRIIVEIGKVLVDRAALGILGPGQLTVRHSRREDLVERIREGRGLILVTAHAGCWQFAMESLRMLETPVSLLLHREEGDVDLHIFEHRGDDAAFRSSIPPVPSGAGDASSVETWRGPLYHGGSGNGGRSEHGRGRIPRGPGAGSYYTLPAGFRHRRSRGRDFPI